jgi:hypothetical protein
VPRKTTSPPISGPRTAAIAASTESGDEQTWIRSALVIAPPDTGGMSASSLPSESGSSSVT